MSAFDLSAIMREAHATARRIAKPGQYRTTFAWALRNAWHAAKKLAGFRAIWAAQTEAEHQRGDAIMAIEARTAFPTPTATSSPSCGPPPDHPPYRGETPTMATAVPISTRPRPIEPDAIEPAFRQQRTTVVLVVVLLCIRREETPT